MSEQNGRAIKQCTLCGWKFDYGAGDDASHVLEHWAKEHEDSEVFWNVLDDYRTHTRCACCAEMFASEIRPMTAPDSGKDALVVDLYCEDCVTNGDLDNKLKSLMVTDVTGRYVIEHSEEVGHDGA